MNAASLPSLTQTPKPANLSSLLIDIKELSTLLRRSVASLERDQHSGRLPTPVRIGGSRLWRRAEIESWVKAGCPIRTQWEQREVSNER